MNRNRIAKIILLFTATFGMNISLAEQTLNVPSVYYKTAMAKGLDPKLLFSIALVESGKKIGNIYGPWPWTLNVKGKGEYFKTREMAVRRLKHILQEGDENVAIGPMQVFWRYNKSYFKNPEQALDPHKNIEVGAEILKFFYNKNNDLVWAIGAYYSPNNEKKAAWYRGKVMSKYQRVRVSQHADT